VVAGIVLWVCVLIYGFWKDWERVRFERLRFLSRSDAMVSLWHIIVDIQQDGSATIKRKIIGKNLATKRKFFEFESQSDLESSPTYEQETKTARAMKVSVHVKRKTGKSQKTFSAEHFEPKTARKVDAVTHIIPLTTPSEGVPELEQNEEFEIEIEEKVKPNTFSMDGDWYGHRVRHPTEGLKIEVLLPAGWHFAPCGVDEHECIGHVKSPTMGEWVETETQLPTTRTVRHRERVMWVLKHERYLPYGEIESEEMAPRLLHVYRLTYGRLERNIE